MFISSLRLVFMEVWLLPNFKMSKLWVIINSNRCSPIRLVKVLSHVKWCALASQPLITYDTSALQNLTSSFTFLLGVDPDCRIGDMQIQLWFPHVLTNWCLQFSTVNYLEYLAAVYLFLYGWLCMFWGLRGFAVNQFHSPPISSPVNLAFLNESNIKLLRNHCKYRSFTILMFSFLPTRRSEGNIHIHGCDYSVWSHDISVPPLMVPDSAKISYVLWHCLVNTLDQAMLSGVSAQRPTSFSQVWDAYLAILPMTRNHSTWWGTGEVF